MIQQILDMEAIKTIVQATADATAARVSEALREEQRRDFAILERSLTDKMDAYFGQLDAAKHVVQHDRMERLLTMFDRMGENLFSSLIRNAIWGLLVLGVMGWFGWKKFTGTF